MATSSFYNSSGSTPAVENSIQTAVTQAAGSATQAATSAAQASTSATNAQNSLSSFQQYYLGAYTSAPSTTQLGAMYFDTGTSQLYIWSGSSWDVTASANNLQNTDGLTEGSSNLYFTDERVDDRVNALLTAGSNVTLTYDDAANTLTIASTATGGSGSSTFLGLTDTPANYTGQAYRYLMVNSTEDGIATVTPNTDDISEGTSNLYYTDARADARIAAAGYITASSTDTLTNKSGNISQWTNNSGYLTGITGQSLYSLSNVNTSASPSDGQVLTWDNANSYWTPAAASSGGSTSFTGLTDTPASLGTAGQYLAVNSGATALEFVAAPSGGSGATTLSGLNDVSNAVPANGQVLTWDNSTSLWQPINPSGGIALTDLSASNNPPGNATLNYNSSTGNFIFTPPDLSPYLQNINSESLSDLSDVNNTAPTNGQVLTWDNANSYWKPATVSTSGGSTSDPNIITGSFTTTSTTYVDAGELLDTDDGFIGAVELLIHMSRGTGSSMTVTLMPCLFAFNPGSPSHSNWTTFPTLGNAASGTYQRLGDISFRFDTSTNKLYLQVKNNAATSTVYNWTGKIV